jgi:hypothetical protein
MRVCVCGRVWEGDKHKTVRARLLLLSNHRIAGRVQSKGTSVYHAHHSLVKNQFAIVEHCTAQKTSYYLYKPTLLSSLTLFQVFMVHGIMYQASASSTWNF